MNKKKIIFLAILWAILFIIIVVLIVWMASNKTVNNKLSANDFKIWILDDSVEDFNLFIEDFKKDSGLKNLPITVESFSDYGEYNRALASAIIKGEAPDLYMLNNNEKSIFLENATWIDPSVISPDDLRSYFKTFFWDDLILTNGEGKEKIEFLVWVPFGFETLWLYYNARLVPDLKKLKSFPKIGEAIEYIDDNKPGITALWIWLWTTVVNSEDIITQFIMSSWIKNISLLSSSDINSSFSEYFDYASGKNNYIRSYNILSKSSRTNIDYFIDWKIAMVFGYPRMLNYIATAWFSKNLLRATNFPDFINESDKLVNYNYFVLNKKSANKNISYAFLKYLFSEEGEKSYLSHFKYYLPARISVYSELKDNTINDSFYIKLKNFYNSEAIYSSFNKWIKDIYDRKIVLIIDNEVNYLQRVSSFVSSLKCMSSKVIQLENLSKKCG
jgi:ABC-type glycerol-3-phosphate transport system substrate-binding protein